MFFTGNSRRFRRALPFTALVFVVAKQNVKKSIRYVGDTVLSAKKRLNNVVQKHLSVLEMKEWDLDIGRKTLFLLLLTVGFVFFFCFTS